MLCTDNFIPMPNELRNTKSPSDTPNKELITKYGFDNWYDWAIKNWGTKWGIYNSRLYRETDVSLMYNFQSAWSPPEPVVMKMAKMYPNLIFRLMYYEQGAGYRGELVLKNGAVTKDVFYDNYRGGRGG